MKSKHVSFTLEIRAAEGGDDAKLLVADQAALYRAFATRIGANVSTLEIGLG